MLNCESDGWGGGLPEQTLNHLLTHQYGSLSASNSAVYSLLFCFWGDSSISCSLLTNLGVFSAN